MNLKGFNFCNNTFYRKTYGLSDPYFFVKDKQQ